MNTATLAEQYNRASDLFDKALHAIVETRRTGRISPEIAQLRVSWLQDEFGATRDVDRKIAACQAMLMLCRHSEANQAEVK